MSIQFRALNDLKKLLELLHLSNSGKIKKLCKNCGYEFNLKSKFVVCGEHKLEDIMFLSLKRRQKIFEKFKGSPNKCPLCSRRLNFLGREENYSKCPKCDFVNLL